MSPKLTHSRGRHCRGAQSRSIAVTLYCLGILKWKFGYVRFGVGDKTQTHAQLDLLKTGLFFHVFSNCPRLRDAPQICHYEIHPSFALKCFVPFTALKELDIETLWEARQDMSSFQNWSDL